MLYYLELDKKIVLFDENRDKLQTTISMIPQYQGLEIKETERPIVDFEFADTEEYAAKIEQQERERKAKLYLTAADVERGIYKSKGLDFEDIVALVTANPPEGLDIKALKIELKANNFYRGNPYIDVVGGLLGFSAKQLDEFFETGDYTALLTPEVDEPADSDSDADNDITESEAE